MKKMLPLKTKCIWIDLDNSPHVPFFLPIIKKLENKGYRITITARDCFQVLGLAKYYGLQYKKIGKHYGSNKILKVLGTLLRSLVLLPTVLRENPDLAVSHGSRSMNLLCYFLGIPSINLFDYEHTKSLPFVKPTLGMAPEVITQNKVSRNFKMGIRGYSGLKEDVYISSFKPDPKVLKQLEIPDNRLIATIRPPANEAHYHNPESEKIFIESVEFIGEIQESIMVILPRNEKSQKEMIIDTWPDWHRSGKIVIPEDVVNGLDLIWHSDFVISGGGTMNREAAALGVPVYSIFRGKIGSVDKYLSEAGRLTLIESVEDVRTKINPVKRNKDKKVDFKDPVALNQIIDAIEDFLKEKF